ncbi:MAG: oligosaccharide flippase family protein [Acidobacteriia bacterium]|nr:oligosaccharide flippase family protein [Terriglobia bacterium]
MVATNTETGIEENRPYDVTGRSRMTWNVVASWMGHMVFVVAGFIMPRIIDRHVGQVSLGIWDFGWSLVNYFGLASLGIGSSVNRHVAMYRAANQPDRLRRMVCSVLMVQAIVAVLVMVLSFLAAWSLPWLFSGRLNSHTSEASWVVVLLGATLAVQTVFDTFRGVMTGCHRWDLHNAINSGAYAATAGAMILALHWGGGLRSMAAVYLAGTAVGEVIRVIVALRVCQELSLSIAEVSRKEAGKMIVFGSKTLVSGLAPLILGQATSIMVASHLGPAALAVYSRPSNLVRNAQTFLNKFAFVLTPMAGSLQGSGQTAELRRFLSETSRFATFLAVPIVLILSIYSDMILRIWMGPRYEYGIILTIMAAGAFLQLSQQSVLNILTGLNMHGRISVISLIAAIAIFGMGAGVLMFVGWSLTVAAVMIVVPLTIANGVVIPVFACRKLNVPILKYVRRVFVAPIACGIPFAACLVASRVLLGHRPWLAIISGCAVGTVVLAPLFWVYMLPERLRALITEHLTAIVGFLHRGTGSRSVPEQVKATAAAGARNSVHGNEAR